MNDAIAKVQSEPGSVERATNRLSITRDNILATLSEARGELDRLLGSQPQPERPGLASCNKLPDVPGSHSDLLHRMIAEVHELSEDLRSELLRLRRL